MTGFSPDVRRAILARSENYCEVMAPGCALMATDIHHRRPRGMGGTVRPESNLASNGLAICRACHLRCESMRNWARENGFVLLQSDNPAEVPVWWRCGWDGSRKALVLLDDIGGKRAAA
jgi:hypothetical protein